MEVIWYGTDRFQIYKGKYKEFGIEFTDWQKAVIIWNNPSSIQDRLNSLRELADKTVDLELKKQIEERIHYEEKRLCYIKHNSNNNYVYIVKSKKYRYDYGAFYMFDTAFEHAKKEALEDQEEICIDKIQTVKDSEIPKCKSCGRWNPILFPVKAEMEEYYEEYSDSEVGGVTISKDGNICYWWSAETTPEERMVVDCFDMNRFESRFIKLPYVHKAGMIVRYTPTGEIGVLETGKDVWDEFMKRVEDELYVDYSDASYIVYGLSEDGYWIHDHISPLLLEEVNVPDMVSDEKDATMYQAMKLLSEFFAGNQTPEQEKEVIRATKAYARAVYEQKINSDDEKEPKDIWGILH